MKVTVLVGGVGGARFLLGAKAALGLPAVGPGPQDAGSTPAHEITAVVNVGDDVWMHGLRITPDLDSCLYTLGGGIDPERGWGRAEETWTVREELAAYGAEPSWFSLGDRDIATHLVRTRMLRAGYRLSDVVTALCHRWRPGVTLLPGTDDRVETHVVVDDPATGPDAKRAIHFQEWWVRHRAELPAHRFVPVGAEEATVLPAARDAILGADAVLLAPSNPVVSIGALLEIPGMRDALRDTGARVVGLSPIVAGRPVRGMADACLTAIGVETTAEAVGRHYGARAEGGLLDGWLVHTGDAADVPGAEVRSVPAAHERRRRDRGDGPRGPGPVRSPGCLSIRRPRGARRGLRILPVPGLPEFRPGDDLAAALATAAPWLADGDVVVVTSKIVSKVEGRLVAAPTDPEARDGLRRELVDAESERVLARRGKTLIVANKLGVVQAAAGVDGSNVRRDELALLPADPDGSAARLRAALHGLLGVDVAVIITDTMGRCWRVGQTDAAIGAAGLTVLHRYGGAVDVEGNELHVTEVALADELAAAADLVKGKLGGVPVAVVRGCAAGGRRLDGPRPRPAARRRPVLPRHGGGAGPGPAGGGAAAAQRARLRRRPGRPRGAAAGGRGGADRARAAPQHPVPVRAGCAREAHGAAGRDGRPLARRPGGRRAPGGRGRAPHAPRRPAAPRTRAGAAVPHRRRHARLPRRRAARARAHDVHRRRRRGRAVAAGGAGRRGARLVLGRVPRSSRRTSCARCWGCPATGSRSARWRSACPRSRCRRARRATRRRACSSGEARAHFSGLVHSVRDVHERSAVYTSAARRMVTPAVAAAELGAWEPPDEAQRALKYALLAFLDARPADACDRSCVPGHLTASALVLDAAGEHVLLTLHPRVGRWIQLGGHCEPGDATLRDAALREATEESGIDGPARSRRSRCTSTSTR